MYVDQPTVSQTVSILRGLKERYEVHHGVRISDNALVEAAVLSDRYLADRWVYSYALFLARSRPGEEGPTRCPYGCHPSISYQWQGLCGSYLEGMQVAALFRAS